MRWITCQENNDFILFSIDLIYNSTTFLLFIDFLLICIEWRMCVICVGYLDSAICTFSRRWNWHNKRIITWFHYFAHFFVSVFLSWKIMLLFNSKWSLQYRILLYKIRLGISHPRIGWVRNILLVFMALIIYSIVTLLHWTWDIRLWSYFVPSVSLANFRFVYLSLK